jgi:hypothetical protein
VRPSFLDSLLGWSYLDGANAIHRILPDEHPDIANFFACDASVQGRGELDHNDNNAIDWTIAEVTANYKPVPYDVKSDNEITTELDRYVTRIYSFSADYLTIQGNMKWVSRSPAGQALSSQPGKTTGTMSMQYVWHEVPGKASNPYVVPNFNAIISCLGRVNSVPFDPNGADCPAGTVLFIGVDPKMQTPKLTDEVFYWEITLSFLYRNNGPGIGGETAGHNYIFDAANNRWDKVTADGTAGGTPIYGSADLNSLFTIT